MEHLLQAEKVITTADVLALRVSERLPGSGLSKVAADVAMVARRAAMLAERSSKPMYMLRAAVWGLCTIVFVAALTAVLSLRVPIRIDNASEFVQSVEAIINIVVFGGIGILFVVSLESRVKRRRILALLASLRSLAHVVDMHQLSKDPDRLDNPLPPTENSPPKLQLTRALLSRYLDYCAEMLALLSKLAALQVQRFDDPITLESVNDLETLTTGLAQKIWAKISILDQLPPAAK